MKTSSSSCIIKKMKFANLFKTFTFAALLVSAGLSSFGQTTPGLPAPREEKLLNGMKLLVWNQPAAAKVNVKLRIHSGSAFDPQGREGVMRLLSEILFPNESVKEFFAEDLGGSLEIVSNYDYIQINASGDTDKFLTILETLSSALTNPQINKESTEKVRAALLVKLGEIEKDPAYLADRAVAKRLLGDFPYGRPQMGTAETVAKIDFADLLLAKQRFLTSDNATLAVSGGIKPEFALRAAKRLFGGWVKADKKVPSTFARPEPPTAGLPIIDSPAQNTSEFRLAFRGLARNDKDFHASMILERILRNRFQAREGQKAFVRQNAHVLPGYFIFGVAGWNLGTIKKEGGTVAAPETNGYQNAFLKDAVKTEEFEKAKAEIAADSNRIDATDLWLDSETYKLTPVKTELQNAQSVGLGDVQRVLERLQKESTAAILVYGGENSTSVTANQ
jgi:predicted Zn-dependent peptidase